ncbi:hypothetical protein ASG14_09930 [Pedobacter sp. Leaf194]|nr:hypothetical protein ASG14_09930 [Pedobacter sp. Leaf194]
MIKVAPLNLNRRGAYATFHKAKEDMQSKNALFYGSKKSPQNFFSEGFDSCCNFLNPSRILL